MKNKYSINNLKIKVMKMNPYWQGALLGILFGVISGILIENKFKIVKEKK